MNTGKKKKNKVEFQTQRGRAHVWRGQEQTADHIFYVYLQPGQTQQPSFRFIGGDV